MAFQYESTLRAIINRLESCSDELKGMGLLGKLNSVESEALSIAGMEVSSVTSDLEDIISGEVNED